MKIDISKNLLEFSPENAEEKAKLETIWRVLIDCVDKTRKLVPVGEYIPTKSDKGAMFYIEGLSGNEDGYREVRVDSDCKCWCENCNKMVDLKKGDPIPLCCGKLMEIID